MNELVNADTLALIWKANGLGAVRSFQQAKRGMNNLATVVNDTHVIRFDVLDLEGECRYKGEQLAYDRLREAGIPAPEVVALDVSKAHIPYHYVILTKCVGRPLIDDWANFSEDQRAEAGRAAGRYLAMLHTITFERFGNLNDLAAGGLPRWFEHVENWAERYGSALAEQGIINITVYNAIRQRVETLRPAFEMTTGGRLVHSDYQFENLLHQNGIITGIIDFEWSLSGDPAWDFKLVDQWDDDCPGSAAYIHEGYTSLRPLPPDHQTRVWLYKLLWHMDSVDMYTGDAAAKDDLAYHYDEMMKALAALEAA